MVFVFLRKLQPDMLCHIMRLKSSKYEVECIVLEFLFSVIHTRFNQCLCFRLIYRFTYQIIVLYILKAVFNNLFFIYLYNLNTKVY